MEVGTEAHGQNKGYFVIMQAFVVLILGNRRIMTGLMVCT